MIIEIQLFISLMMFALLFNRMSEEIPILKKLLINLEN